MLSTVFSILAPHFCIVCNREGSLLCAGCSLTNLPVAEPLCVGCGKTSSGFKICEQCKPRLGVHRVWPATPYGDVAKQLVHAMKFTFARDAAAEMARLMATRLPALPSNAIFVPIPTATSRVRQRGFDHAKLIAKTLAKSMNGVYSDVIRRQGKTRQVGADRRQRAGQLVDSFWLRSSLPKDAIIVLVDDVCTTGATIGAAAHALRAAGYTKMYAATFAFTI